MNRINKIFFEKKTNILNLYCTAGYPHLNSTIEVMTALQEYGADIIELGMPYSDPIADGPVIQQSNMSALENGMSIPLLFEQLKGLREKIRLPVILMGYLNPVMQYGMERFCADASAAGIDGVILPDLPIYEYETSYRPVFEKYRLHFIFLVTPETGADRIRKIDQVSNGFIYAVSSSSTTGNSDNPAHPLHTTAYLRKLQNMKLANPVLVGFGIKDREGFREACRYSSGVIIGSAYIKALGEGSGIGETTKVFLKAILGHPELIKTK